MTGVPPNAVETLTLANGNDSPIQLQPWLDEVRSSSKGRLRIRVLSRWREGQPGFETGLIADVRSGRVGLGWVGARAWSAQGVHGFDAFNAPFLVDSYGAEQAALRVADGQRLLAGVAAADVEPVAMLPGPLHLLLTRRPVADPAALRGLKIGVAASQIGERALRRLGALPVPMARGASMKGLDGIETGPGDLAAYVGQARYLIADGPLWPAVRVLFANRKTWSRVSRNDRTILRRAAERAFDRTLRESEADDRAALVQLCDGGVRLVKLGAPGRAAFRRAVGPLYAALRGSAGARAGFDAVERGRAVGPPPTPLTCKPPARSQAPALTGTFVWTLRRGTPGSGNVEFEGARSVRYRLELRNSRAVQTVVFPDGHSEPGFDEKYAVYRDRITFGGDHGPPGTARWRLDGDRLSFSEMSPDDPAGHLVWESHTWVRTPR